jgi:hypothetical protein
MLGGAELLILSTLHLHRVSSVLAWCEVAGPREFSIFWILYSRCSGKSLSLSFHFFCYIHVWNLRTLQCSFCCINSSNYMWTLLLDIYVQMVWLMMAIEGYQAVLLLRMSIQSMLLVFLLASFDVPTSVDWASMHSLVEYFFNVGEVLDHSQVLRKKSQWLPFRNGASFGLAHYRKLARVDGCKNLYP